MRKRIAASGTSRSDFGRLPSRLTARTITSHGRMRMAALKIHTFGPPRLERGEQLIDLGLRKALALIVYLAVTRQPHSRDALATMLWPEGDQREGRGRLRRMLHRVAEALGGDVFAIDGDTVGMRPGLDLWLDCAA